MKKKDNTNNLYCIMILKYSNFYICVFFHLKETKKLSYLISSFFLVAKLKPANMTRTSCRSVLVRRTAGPTEIYSQPKSEGNLVESRILLMEHKYPPPLFLILFFLVFMVILG